MAAFDEMVGWIVPALGAGPGEDPARTASFAVFAPRAGTFQVRVRGAGPATTLTLGPAERHEFGAITLYAGSVTLRGLTPDQGYDLELVQDGTPVDRCSVRTWPTALGTRDQPFRVFLGSCYAVHAAAGGNDLTQLVRLLRGKERAPHLKLLCGDQVYLDIPVMERVPPQEPALRELLARKYLDNWQPHREDARRTYGELLRAGSTLFLTDDHEYWNNYPFLPAYKPALWEPAIAEPYARAARELSRTFQLVPPTLRTYVVGTAPRALHLALLDGRTQRDKARELAHAPADLAALRAFLASATGPALVVLSQPLFEPQASPLARTFADRGLADLNDYGALVDALHACPHDVLVLSGDIHYGRVCSTFKRARPGENRGRMLLEVVASPLSLVRGGSYGTAIPTLYPAPGKSARSGAYGPIDRHFGPVCNNHGCMLDLWSYGRSLGVAVRFIACATGTALGASQRPFQLA